MSLRGRGASGGAGGMGRGRLCTFPRLPRHSVMAALSPCSQACSSSCGHRGVVRGLPWPLQQHPSQCDASCSKASTGTRVPLDTASQPLTVSSRHPGHPLPLGALLATADQVPQPSLCTQVTAGHHHMPWTTTATPPGALLVSPWEQPAILCPSGPQTTHVPLGTADHYHIPQPPCAPPGLHQPPLSPQGPPLTSSLPWNSHSLPLLSLGTEDRHQCHVCPLCHPSWCRALT